MSDYLGRLAARYLNRPLSIRPVPLSAFEPSTSDRRPLPALELEETVDVAPQPPSPAASVRDVSAKRTTVRPPPVAVPPTMAAGSPGESISAPFQPPVIAPLLRSRPADAAIEELVGAGVEESMRPGQPEVLSAPSPAIALQAAGVRPPAFDEGVASEPRPSSVSVEAPSAAMSEARIVQPSEPGITARLAEGTPEEASMEAPAQTPVARLANPADSLDTPPSRVVAPGQATREMSSEPPPSEAPRVARVMAADLEHLGPDPSTHPSMVGPASQDLRALEPRPALEDMPPLAGPSASFGRGRQSTEGPPIVEISIGEIEVRAAPTPQPARVHGSERAPFRPPMSLEEYLRRRAAGGR